MQIPNEKLFRRAMKVPDIHKILKGMTEEQQLYHLCVCYNCIAKGLMEIERSHMREAQPFDSLLAAAFMVRDGDFQLIEDQDGNIKAYPTASLTDNE